ncbi:cytochrome c family protein [Flavobacterium sp. H122]|uniref:cytochrome c family protein n=1 Tax=Flavobacterium sp. H122 TaxID=2529860 RepID=UPI0010AAAD24|nr:cytochrome c family protein [Flavobacterium sp. H122]
MKSQKYKFLIILFIILTSCILLSGINFDNNKYIKVPKTDNTCDCYSTSSLYNVKINFNNNVPGDLPSFNNQSQADCFAWQEFIALNWPTNGSNFGQPGDFSPVAWETYMPKDVLFQPNGIKPPSWGTLVSPAYAAKFKTQKILMKSNKTKLLTFSAKFADTDTIKGLDPNQAAPFGKPNWLGAQNGTNVWYEIMLNKDYYDFVVNNGYYNAIVQHDSVQKGSPINFPQGVYNGAVGAIELKAAWMEVDSIQSPKWQRYKLSKAVVMDAYTGQLRNTTVALVGLHILHKTQNQPTWVWATFEHIDNVPNSTTETPPPYGYNFYNKNCTSKQVNLKGGGTASVDCTANVSPPYYLTQAQPVPIQLTRVNSIDSEDAAPINAKMQNSIQSFYPNSVFQYYQLVDVIWSQLPQPDPTTPIQAPRKLNNSSMLSGKTIVANSTMESYVQNKNTCISCHVYSTIAPYNKDTINNNVFGDFSFAISAAKYPSTSKIKKGKRKI